MTSSRPYLVRALYEWILDNEQTPYLLVNAQYPGAQVPIDYVNNGQIVLNLAPPAIRGLAMENTQIRFAGRFAGVSQELVIPIGAVLAIYAKENGQGMVFEEEPLEPEPPTGATPQSTDKPKGPPVGRPRLKVVK